MSRCKACKGNTLYTHPNDPDRCDCEEFTPRKTKHYFKVSFVVYFEHDSEHDDYPPTEKDMSRHFDPVFDYETNKRETLPEEIQIAEASYRRSIGATTKMFTFTKLGERSVAS